MVTLLFAMGVLLIAIVGGVLLRDEERERRMDDVARSFL